MKCAYIDCEYIFEYEAQNDIKNPDGRINPAHHPGDSLQRMEMDDLIASQWKLSGKSRPRRYYTITEKGCKELASELVSWRNVWQAFSRLAKPVPAED